MSIFSDSLRRGGETTSLDAAGAGILPAPWFSSFFLIFLIPLLHGILEREKKYLRNG